MTGAEARMSDKVGADFSAWDEYIRGRNLELVPGERIVQAWRTSKFTGENEDSIVTITLEEADDGTLFTLVHSNVPDEQRNYEEGGWESNYFAPMRAYFAGLAEEDEAEEDRKVVELDLEEEESEDEHNGDEDDEDEEEDEEDDEDDDDDEEDEDEDEDEDEEDEDEDEEDELTEELEEQRLAKVLEVPEHAPARPPAVKRTAGRPAKKAAPRGKALPGKKTKRAAAAHRKAKPKRKLMGKAKKKTAAKRARPAAKRAKLAASKRKSAGRRRARR
jgi:hypothetical protein